MTRTVFVLLVLCIVLAAAPAMAARVASTPVVHNMDVYQAYPGCSLVRDTDQAANRCWQGYHGNSEGSETINAVPGILCIDPGDNAWCNYVAAAQASTPVPYTIKTTTLTKAAPSFVQCGVDANGIPIFPAHVINQQGTPNIRTWWPLMYEVPGTTFTLTILYGTPSLFDDDDMGPNPPSWAHVEQWIWTVVTDFESLSHLLQLFHELPFGKDEVPLISDETLYVILQAKLAAAAEAFEQCKLAEAAFYLADFELEVMDACLYASPAYPNPTGIGTGIANTPENPACCKLLVDAEYILQTTGIGQPKK